MTLANAVYGETTSEVVNGLGRVTQETAAGVLGTGTTGLAYDAVGNVMTRTLPGGKTQTLRWDALGRLTRVEERNASNTGYNWGAHDKMPEMQESRNFRF